MCEALGGDERPNRNGSIHGHSAIAEIPDGACVRAAANRLELIDDLHGADFGSATDGAGGKARPQDVERAELLAQRPFYLADEMEHVTVPLNVHEAGNADGTVPRDAADIVSAEVDEHEVLGALFRIGEEVLGEGGVLFVGGAAYAGAGDGPYDDTAVLDPHEDLRRRPNQRDAIELEEIQIWRRVERAKGAVEVERIGLERHGEPLAEDYLEGVTGGDVF